MMNISNPFFTKSENFSESHTESKLSPEYSNLNENMKMEEVSVVMTNHLPNPSIKMDESRIQSNQMPNPHKSVEEASMILANQLKNRKAEDATMVLASQLQSTTRNAEDVSMILANKFPNPHNNTEDSSIGKGNHLPNHISNEGLTKSPPTPMILKSINVNVPTTRSNSLIQYSLDSRLTEYAYDSNDSFARKRRNSESVNANRKKGFFSTDAKDGDNHIVDDSYQREQLINRLIKENQELANKCRRYEDHLGARDQRIQLLQKELEDKANQLHRASQFKEMLNRYRDLLPDGKMTTL
ncbi:hypothetical protein BC833DRAFT_190411 [Globomyces pollinis-pini]|nr:hypothetical protein BC833DRAFT_190411 [Globomyces pollinis-pini]KAJ3000294.1 hypothetical protein HDV02_006506 [Globomyces sp. JEL0801]